MRNETQAAALLRSRGIKVYAVSVGNLELPEAVMRQRVRSWAVNWQKEALTRLADADVKIEKLKEEARAEAQRQIVETFKDTFNEFKEGYKQTLVTKEGVVIDQREVTQRLVSALNKVADDPVTQMLAPGNTVKQLSNLRQWVGLSEEEAAPEPQLIGEPKAETGEDVGIVTDEAGEASETPAPEDSNERPAGLHGADDENGRPA
jgi:hypothetical protein